MSVAFDRVVTALGDRVHRHHDGQVQAYCPAHPDREASLSVGIGNAGAVLKCFAGCKTEWIAAALGLTMADLFDTPPTKKTGRGRGGRHTAQRNNATLQHGCTLAAYAAAKRLPIEKLRTFGLTDITYNQIPAVRIPYRDVDGQERAVRMRLALQKGPDGDQRFVWRRGSKVALYGLDRLPEARTLNYVVMVEGESDTQTLWCKGIPAIGLPGAAVYKDEWAPYLDGIETIYITIEPDCGGEAVLRWLAQTAIRDRARLASVSTEKGSLNSCALAVAVAVL